MFPVLILIKQQLENKSKYPSFRNIFIQDDIKIIKN